MEKETQDFVVVIITTSMECGRTAESNRPDTAPAGAGAMTPRKVRRAAGKTRQDFAAFVMA
ncbi:hypothetical protein [Rhodospirillum centenum]|uniref:hypothetical protein n=1 Tax=Rhodospirillum centenum TaxID=34018 RepID=UPI0005A00638|nr:hypothetical protein [Rhodospirillum centenum]